MQKIRKWSWVVITVLSLANIIYVSLTEGFVEGKVWPFLVTLALGLYFCYRNFIKK
jgi:hypothetical protein